MLAEFPLCDSSVVRLGLCQPDALAQPLHYPINVLLADAFIQGCRKAVAAVGQIEKIG
ncbi:hypothetical protein [Scandinavium manionii]|uniref:hypothetical protein n=1 Tax=Scandinavium manionii TaxID=2926520 RepID=UPI0021658858|nr:hypothetical protein [Scandinavium manionii]MCS2147740.1 hypothetical protein [Scandinavium manionii]